MSTDPSSANSRLHDEEFESNYAEVVDNFDNMGLVEELLRGIYAYGFEKVWNVNLFPYFRKPSAIQQRAIIPLMKGMDLIAQAQSGNLKNFTFWF